MVFMGGFINYSEIIPAAARRQPLASKLIRHSIKYFYAGCVFNPHHLQLKSFMKNTTKLFFFFLALTYTIFYAIAAMFA
jgi:hypothetical protein